MEITTEPNDGDELDALADLALETELADDAEPTDATATDHDDDPADIDEASARADGASDDEATSDDGVAEGVAVEATASDDVVPEASDDEDRPSLVASLVEAARRSSGWRPVSLSFEALAVVDGLGPHDESDDMVDRDFLGWAPAGCAVEPTWRNSFIESATRALRAEHLADDSPDRPDPTALEDLAGVIGRLEQQVPSLVVAAVVRLKDTLPLVSRSAGRGLHPTVAAAALAGVARSGQAAVEMMGGVELFGPTELVSIRTADARCIIDHLDRDHALVVVVDREHAEEEAAVDQLLVELRPDWLSALAAASSAA